MTQDQINKSWFNQIKTIFGRTWEMTRELDQLNQEEEQLHQVLQEHYEQIRNETRKKYRQQMKKEVEN